MKKVQEALILSADTFLSEKNLSVAIICYTKALSYGMPKEEAIRVLNNLGVAYKQNGQTKEAINVFLKGINTDATYGAFYTNLASLYRLLQRYQEALNCLVMAVEKTNTIRSYSELSEFLRFLKKPQEAVNVALSAVEKFPKSYEAHLTLGNLFSSYKVYDKAIKPYSEAILIDENRTEAYNNIGIAYKELGQNEAAFEAYEKALKLNPNDSASHNNFGNLLRNMGDFEAAISHLEKSIAINPNYADAYSNIGAIYKEQKEYEKAEPYYQKALSINKDHTNANFDMSLIELSRGNYAKGWRLYEHRLKMAELISKTYRFTTPMWQGDSLDGKTIVLQNEQGFGDNIMFIRYAYLFMEMGARVIVRTRPHLVELFKSLKGVVEVCSEEEEMPKHDCYIPLLSSPHYFKTMLSNIPSSFPYLHTEKAETSLLPQSKKGELKVGIVWSNSRTSKDFKNRYIGLSSFKPLFELENIAWYSLQEGEDASQIKKEGLEGKIVDLSDKLTDFKTTAMIVQELDLVITPDTAVAHLCGALNKSAWVVVPNPSDWKWLQEGSKSPWYESLRVFRQERGKEWAEPVLEIKEELIIFAKNNIKEENNV